MLHVIFNTLISFATLFLFSKLSGKKQIAQLEFIDYVIAISIGSIAAEMTFDRDEPFYHFIIAMGIFFALNLFVTLLSRKAVFLKKIFNGKPLILIEEGKINYPNLKKSKLDTNELLALCRLEGYFDLKDVCYAILEINGQISILPTAPATPVTAKDISAPFEKPSLSNDIIIDGKIIDEALKQSGKSRQWLFERLNVEGENELKNIILAVYDLKLDEIIKHEKY